MRRSIIACGLLLGFAGISSAATAADGHGRQSEPTMQGSSDQAGGHSAAYWNAKAQHAQAVAKRWVTVIHGRPPHGFSSTSSRKSSSAQGAQANAQQWQQRANAARKKAHHPPQLRAWNCIHSHEGAWTDPNAPYWGGLQMDMNFQSAYGKWLLNHKGTADHWTPLEQIWAGVRAWRTRGFEPWSSSAHACGVY
jgi:hypothetical protein